MNYILFSHRIKLTRLVSYAMFTRSLNQCTWHTNLDQMFIAFLCCMHVLSWLKLYLRQN